MRFTVAVPLLLHNDSLAGFHSIPEDDTLVFLFLLLIDLYWITQNNSRTLAVSLLLLIALFYTAPDEDTVAVLLLLLTAFLYYTALEDTADIPIASIDCFIKLTVPEEDTVPYSFCWELYWITPYLTFSAFHYHKITIPHRITQKYTQNTPQHLLRITLLSNLVHNYIMSLQDTGGVPSCREGTLVYFMYPHM